MGCQEGDAAPTPENCIFSWGKGKQKGRGTRWYTVKVKRTVVPDGGEYRAQAAPDSVSGSEVLGRGIAELMLTGPVGVFLKG